MEKKKKGLTREDGKVFWSYCYKGKSEWWVSKDKYDEMNLKERDKRLAKYKLHKEKNMQGVKIKRGTTNSEGLLFWGYHDSYANGEWWMTKEKFEDKKKWKKEHDANWNKENEERMNFLKRRWDKDNKDKLPAFTAKSRFLRRSRKKANGGKISGDELNAIKDKAKGKCFYCGVKKKLSFDHVNPLKLGGTNSVDNIVMACINCNSRKQAQDPIVYARKIGRLLI